MQSLKWRVMGKCIGFCTLKAFWRAETYLLPTTHSAGQEEHTAKKKERKKERRLLQRDATSTSDNDDDDDLDSG